MTSGRKILFLAEKSFLLLRKKEIPLPDFERLLPGGREVASLLVDLRSPMLIADSRELVKEALFTWKKLFLVKESDGRHQR
ncbi:MAG: hypothetical protein RDV48_10535 [Candidatus Eremiobacteraeota bacterium]|nr:hypothetical protein [Candidatus Eremiobacteraeota bacterium]